MKNKRPKNKRTTEGKGNKNVAHVKLTKGLEESATAFQARINRTIAAAMAMPGQTAPTTQGQTKTEEKQQAPVQQAPAGNNAGSPIRQARSHNLLYAENLDAISNFRKAAMAHADAVYDFEHANISNYSEISRACDRVQQTRHKLIEARQRVLKLNRSDD